MMSCYHLDARNQASNNQDIDKSLWKLDRWRHEHNKKMYFETNKNSNIAYVPVLRLSEEIRKL